MTKKAGTAAAARKVANKKETLSTLENIAKQKGITAAYRGTFYPNDPTLEYLQSQGYSDKQAKAYIAGFNATKGSAEIQMQRFVANQITKDRYACKITTTKAALIKRFQSWELDAIDEYIKQTTASDTKNQENQDENEDKLKKSLKMKLANAVRHSIAQGFIPHYPRFQSNYKLDENPDLLETLASTFLECRISLNEYFEKYSVMHKSKKDKATDTLSQSGADNLRIAFLMKYKKFIDTLIVKIKSPQYKKELDTLDNQIATELKKYAPSQNNKRKKVPITSGPKRNLEEEKSPSYSQKESSNVDKYYTDLTVDISLKPIQRLFNFVISLRDYIIVHNNLLDNDRLGYLVYLYCLIIELKPSYANEESRNTMQDLAIKVIDPVLEKIQNKNLSYYLPQEGKNYRHLPAWHIEQHTRVEKLEETLEQLKPLVKKNDDAKSAENFNLVTELKLHDSKYLQELSSRNKKKRYVKLVDKSNGVRLNDNLLTPDTKALLLANLGVVNAAVEKTLQSLDGKQANKIFCAIRPPSHHAQHDHASGFCLMNTVVAAALRLIKENRKVMIIDFDVHHGDGNYAQFMKIHEENESYREYYRLIDVYIEAQHAPFIKNQPSAAKPEYSSNISLNELKEGYTGLDLLNTIGRAVEKFDFKPDVILVCAGFDALKKENFHGGVENPQDYYAIGAYLASLSDNVISFLEGGYKLQLLAQSVFYYVLGTGTLLPNDNQLPMLQNASELNETIHQVTNGIEHVYQQARNKDKTDAPTATPTISNNKSIKLG